MKKVSMIGLSFLAMTAVVTVFFFNSCTKDACKDVICLNGGVCSDGTCINCDAGFEGSDCGTESRAKFVGTYSVSGTVACGVTGNTTINPSVLTITSSSGAAADIVINFAGQLTIIGTVSGSSISIESQLVNTFTYTGSGSINGNNITLTINEFDPSYPETCVYSLTGPKQ